MLRKRKEIKGPVNQSEEQKLIKDVSIENSLTEQKPMEINPKKQRLPAKNQHSIKQQINLFPMAVTYRS